MRKLVILWICLSLAIYLIFNFVINLDYIGQVSANIPSFIDFFGEIDRTARGFIFAFNGDISSVSDFFGALGQAFVNFFHLLVLPIEILVRFIIWVAQLIWVILPFNY